MAEALTWGGLVGILCFAVWGRLSPDPSVFGQGRSDRQILVALIGMYLCLAAAFVGVWLR